MVISEIKECGNCRDCGAFISKVSIFGCLNQNFQKGVKAIKDSRYTFFADVSPIELLTELIQKERERHNLQLSMKDTSKAASPSSETQPSAEGGENGTNCSSAGTHKGSVKNYRDQIVEFYLRVSFNFIQPS